MNIIAVRHGQTDGNRKGAVYGHPSQGLSDLGRKQARQVALYLRDEDIVAIYSSDLQRCIETTEIIAKHHPDTPVTYLVSLREIGGGSMHRLPLRLPSWLLSRLVQLALKLNVAPPGGESWYKLKTRITDVLNEIYKQHPDATILLVTHNVAIQAICVLLRVSTDDRFDDRVVPNCAAIHCTMNDFIKSS